MSKGSEKRKYLFYKFSNQLLLLRQLGLIDFQFKNANPYICPICLLEFNEGDLELSGKNHLTLEDAPPNALRGSKIALTCRKCNNDCGKEIDEHLTRAIRAIDASYFYKGSVQNGTIEFEGKRITVELTSQGDGTLKAYHRVKKNNPTLLDKFIYGLKNRTIGPMLNLAPPRFKFDPKRVNYALVKANYIITFAKFGYIFLLDPRFDSIRQQLLNPADEIYPWTPFIKDQFSRDRIGTYYMHNGGVQSIFNVFSLRTEYSETLIGGMLPLPRISMDQYVQGINNMRDHENYIVLDTSNYDPDANLFTDIDEILKIHRWIERL